MGGRDSGSFACPTCGHLVFFENFSCLNCGTQLGFGRPEHTLLAQPGSGRARCANAGIADCNWLADRGGPLCGCCALTRTRPADTDQAGMAAFARVEAAKRRLVFQLDELALPTGGVVFDLLSSSAEPVTTGHDDGVVTIDLAEGDDGHREALRVQLTSPTARCSGTLRHETGHWYWTVLVEPDPEPFRPSSATSGPTTRRRWSGTTEEPRRLGGARGQHLRDGAPLGGLGRDLRALPAHPGHPGRPRPATAWSCGARTRPPGPRWPRPRPPTRRASRRSSTPGCR